MSIIRPLRFVDIRDNSELAMFDLKEHIITYLMENIDIEAMSKHVQSRGPEEYRESSYYPWFFKHNVETAFNHLLYQMKSVTNKDVKRIGEFFFETVEIKIGKRKLDREASNQKPKRQRLAKHKIHKMEFAPFSFIPNEIWIKEILCHLPEKDLLSMSETSRKFKTLCQDPRLWKKLILDYETIMDKPSSCFQLMKRCTMLKELKITNEQWIHTATPILMNLLVMAKNTLNELDIDITINLWNNCYSVEKLRQLVHLKRLKIYAMEGDEHHIIDQIMYLTELEVLIFKRRYNINHLDGIDERERRKLDARNVQLFSKLTKLKVLDYDWVEKWDEQGTLTLLENNPDLTAINLHSVCNEGVCIKTESSMQFLAKNFPALEHITVEGDSIELIISKCRKLKSLDIRNNFTAAVNDEKLALLGELPDLKFLYISKCPNISEEGLKQFLIAAKKLEEIDISSCSGISDTFYKDLKTQFPRVNIYRFDNDLGFNVIRPSRLTHLYSLTNFTCDEHVADVDAGDEWDINYDSD